MQLTTSILLATATLAALGHAEERQDLQNPKNTKLNCVGADPAHVRRICSNLQGDWVSLVHFDRLAFQKTSDVADLSALLSNADRRRYQRVLLPRASSLSMGACL